MADPVCVDRRMGREQFLGRDHVGHHALFGHPDLVAHRAADIARTEVVGHESRKPLFVQPRGIAAMQSAGTTRAVAQDHRTAQRCGGNGQVAVDRSDGRAVCQIGKVVDIDALKPDPPGGVFRKRLRHCSGPIGHTALQQGKHDEQAAKQRHAQLRFPCDHADRQWWRISGFGASRFRKGLLGTRRDDGVMPRSTRRASGMQARRDLSLQRAIGTVHQFGHRVGVLGRIPQRRGLTALGTSPCQRLPAHTRSSRPAPRRRACTASGRLRDSPS